MADIWERWGSFCECIRRKMWSGEKDLRKKGKAWLNRDIENEVREK